MTTKKQVQKGAPKAAPRDAPEEEGRAFRTIAEMEHAYFPISARERRAKRGLKHEGGTGFATAFLETMRAELAKHT
jgi:hypothetical protein